MTTKLRWVERKTKNLVFTDAGWTIERERVLQVWDPEKFNDDWREIGGWVDVPLEVEE